MKMNTKSITIHGLSSELNNKIQKKSKEFHLSQNKTVKKILEDSLFENNNNKEEFSEFLGLWSELDLSEFNKRVKELRMINKEDWK